MSLDDLLDLLPGLRRVRQLNADWLRILLNRQDRECTWCGGLVPKGSRTWCGAACVEAFRLRCDAGHVRAFVERRDGGTCQRCGRDTLKAERDAKARRLTAYPYRERDETEVEFEIRRRAAVETLRQLGYARGRWREVDHAVPVCLGGGLCRVEELRLLCGVCHADATRQLAQDRKRRKAVK